jgi:hypothetical protein
MQLIVLQLLSGMVTDVIRHVFAPMKKVWSEAGKAEKEGFLLSPVSVKEIGYGTQAAQDKFSK